MTSPARLVQRGEAGTFWGEGERGEGQNMLGKLWMQVRDRLADSGEFDGLAQPLPPPWERHPDIEFSSIGWRMGSGEAYMDEWYAFFDGLSPAGRQRYRAIYPALDDWEGFYET